MEQSKEEFIDQNTTTINKDDLSQVPKPFSSCKKCYGRGYDSWHFDTGEPVICTCIQNKIGKVIDMNKLLTYGELQELMSVKKVIETIEGE